MLPYPDHYTASNKAIFESQLAAFRQLSGIAIEGTEKLVALNLAAAKASADDSAAAVRELLSAENPQAFIALATTFAKPNVEKFAAFNQHLSDIVAATKAEFEKAAEVQSAEVRSKVDEFVGTVAKTASTVAEAPKSSVRKVDEAEDAPVAKGSEPAAAVAKKSKRETIEE